jgi:hypothetical protein
VYTGALYAISAQVVQPRLLLAAGGLANCSVRLFVGATGWLNRLDTLFPVHGLGSIASLVQEACDLRGAWLAKQTGVTVPRPWAGQSYIPGSNSSRFLVFVCVCGP